MGANVNLGSVEETALSTVNANAEARVLYTVGQKSYEDVLEMLEIYDQEEVDNEDTTEGLESSY